MKARNIYLPVLVALILVTNVVTAFAAEDATITITMAGPEVAIDVVDISAEPPSWLIRPVNLNSSYSKAFTLTNTGNVRVDTTIKGTDASGSGYHWTLNDNIGINQYLIEYTVEGQTGTVNILTTPDDFIENLQESESMNFLLRLKTPTSGDVPAAGQSMQATVTIHAVKG